MECVSAKNYLFPLVRYLCKHINIINAVNLVTNSTYCDEVFLQVVSLLRQSKVTSVPLRPRIYGVFDLKLNNLLFRFQFRHFRNIVFAFQSFVILVFDRALFTESVQFRFQFRHVFILGRSLFSPTVSFFDKCLLFG